METLSLCPLCQSAYLSDFQIFKDHFGNNEDFQIMCCNHCTLLFTNPRPDSDEIINYYKSSGYISHGDRTHPVIDFIYQRVQHLNFKYKYKHLQKHHHLTKNSILDFGCGSGNWLRYLKQQSWNVMGTEPDDVARDRAALDNIQVYNSLDSISLEKKFSVITAFHVLEHVHHLHETVKELKSRLSEHGILMLALPNHASYDAKNYGSFWAGWDVPRHFYHFKPKDVSNLAQQFGLKIVDQLPLRWDSFYVSLLSEQYMKHKFPMPRAFYHGLKSNLKANKNGNYSSLIYVLRKT